MSHTESGHGVGLRVAYVVSMATGLHRFVFREIRELTSNGVQVELYPTKVGSGPYEPPPGCRINAPRVKTLVLNHIALFSRSGPRYLRTLIEAFSFGAFVDFALAGCFAGEMERHGIRVIHCHFGDHKLFIGYFCGLLTRRPVSVTIHAYELYNNPNPKLFAHVLQRVDGLITISEFNRRVLERKWHVPPSRVDVVRLFAELPGESAPRLNNQSKIVILVVARLVEKKGHRTLLRAFARLPPDYELWIVGTGPLDVRRLASEEGVDGRVKFLGRLDNESLETAYRNATLFCLPSETSPEGDREGIPVALMEAMAHGLPVVATRHAGIPELVESILVDEGDVNGIATALLMLGRDPVVRKEMGERNRDIIAERFSRGNVFLLESIFARLANAPP